MQYFNFLFIASKISTFGGFAPSRSPRCSREIRTRSEVVSGKAARRKAGVRAARPGATPHRESVETFCIVFHLFQEVMDIDS
jgi:hypothetical protein